MNVEIDFPRVDTQQRVFLTWRPVEAKLRLVAPPAGSPSVSVTLTSSSTGAARLLFAQTLTHAGTPSIDVDLAAAGGPVSIWIGGARGAPSISYGDVTIEVRDRATQAMLGERAVMIRVRKDANNLTNVERDRFLSAFAALNGSGLGRFSDFRAMHTGTTSSQAHGEAGFLPWHRAYLLDLERELQAIDPEVSLPYWRFDQTAPNLFTPQFMGVADNIERVQFNPGHPLLNWVTDGVQGIVRGGGVTGADVPFLLDEVATLALGGDDPNADFAFFRDMEGDPHGAAHTSFGGGFVGRIGTAAKDPLFFLLHCNVDRLWAKWQFAHERHDPAVAMSFDPSSTVEGHRLGDTMWPWNGITGGTRPSTAPGGGLEASPMTNAPGAAPRVRDMIDYFAIFGGEPLGFAYDDVPFRN